MRALPARRPVFSVTVIALMAFSLAIEPMEASARATADGQIARARDRFDYGDYADAIRILSRLLDEGRLVSSSQLVEAYRLLGVSLYYISEEDDSRAAFVRLLSVEPDFRLDPFFHPPKLVEFFDEVRAENEALLAPLRDQRKRLEEQQRLEEEARRRLLDEEERRRAERQRRLESEAEVVLERLVSRNTYIVNWLPFGAGQFQNEQAAKGIGLATAQVVTGAASILGYAFVAAAPRCYEVSVPIGSPGQVERTERTCGVPAESENLVRNMNRMKWVTGAMFWGLIGYGIVDAHLHYEPMGVVSERTIRRPAGDGSRDTLREQETDAARDDVSSPRTRDDERSPAISKTRTMAISPWLADDGAGALLTFRF